MRINIEKNFQSMCIKCSKLSGLKEITNSYYSAALNPYDTWFSRIYNIDIPKNRIHSEINIIKSKIENKLLPDTLLIKKNELNQELEEALITSGFKLLTVQTLMSADLTKLKNDDMNYSSTKIIDNENDFQEWFSLVKTVFGKMDIELYNKLLEDKDTVFLAAYKNGVLSSTTMLYFEDDIVGLHLVGTNLESRGYGLGTLITKYALNYIKNKGYQSAVLQASKMGKPIYEKLGFIANDKILHWKYEL